MKGLLKVLFVSALLLGMVWGGLTVFEQFMPHSKPLSSVKVGSELDDLDLYPIGSGQPKKISSLKAKIYILNFWATWCEACVVEMPSLVALRNKFKNEGVELIPINLDQVPETALPEAKKLGIDFESYYDKDQKLSALLNVHAIPLTVFLDQNLKILSLHPGERDWNTAGTQDLIKNWLKLK